MQSNQQSSSITIVPTGASLGAEVQGVDLAQPVGETTRRALIDAWARHMVLLFRGQVLSPAAQIDAARIFGQPEIPAAAKYYEAVGKAQNATARELMVISNLGPDGKPTAVNDGLGSGEVHWHSDNSYIEAPPAGSMLYSLEIPPDGGETSFANQYAAYETLPPDIKKALVGRYARHDASRNSAGVLRPGLSEPRTPDEVPGPNHPLVRTHPLTARPALYLGRRRSYPSQFVIDMETSQSESLLDTLWSHATKPQFVWTHRWRVGDVLLWDNRAVMHRREGHDPTKRRIMHRVQIEGEAVVAA
ncbi:MAG: TauD/TfdA family dioxygenase [Pseudomonadota bacterium]